MCLWLCCLIQVSNAFKERNERCLCYLRLLDVNQLSWCKAYRTIGSRIVVMPWHSWGRRWVGTPSWRTFVRTLPSLMVVSAGGWRRLWCVLGESFQGDICHGSLAQLQYFTLSLTSHAMPCNVMFVSFLQTCLPGLNIWSPTSRRLPNKEEEVSRLRPKRPAAHWHMSCLASLIKTNLCSLYIVPLQKSWSISKGGTSFMFWELS